MATAQITAPTPMMMPSMVRMVRILLRASARSATRTTSLRPMRELPPRPGPTRRACADGGAGRGGRSSRGLLAGDENIPFVQIALDQLRVVEIRDAALNSERNRLLVRT